MVFHDNSTSWFTTEWISWSKYSETMLRSIEKKILQNIKSAYRGWFVDIGPVVGKCDKIWTISLNTDSPNTPLVLLHGFGAGVALWCLNLDSLAASRPVFAIDLLGFGRSSRPKFSTNALEAENQMVKAIEEWRKEMNLENFVLLGHSMGGFLATSYAISHPHRVKHLILADPWGFPERPAEQTVQIPLWVKVLAFTLQPFNPLWAVRAAGPFGQWLINKARPDISRKYEAYVNDVSLIPQYIYQCNSQKPSGESAFHSMSHFYAWAKHPMVKRIHGLHKDVPITLMYGSKSWVEKASEMVKEGRVDCHTRIINGAGHHVYADKADIFNKYTTQACNTADSAQGAPILSRNVMTTNESNLQHDENNYVILICNFSGESAFHSMMQGIGWAKHPMVKRIHELNKDVPITLMYGAKSWVDNMAAEIVKETRINSFVQSHIIMGAGHHVYADKPEVFNKHVADACATADGDTSFRRASLITPDETNLDLQSEESQLNKPNTTTPNT
ncbi:hypothetical protein MML48_2g00006759 [Holotrichia oblita]|uniref:Uncharacterized protein n=1 Tax=Holotrichia oblita TaxID=644536 RepID=A0ACB9TKK0_HOLOL|nr:hypothetical protein MML48_2g00006759 [Holotrichia oblita]